MCRTLLFLSFCVSDVYIVQLRQGTTCVTSARLVYSRNFVYFLLSLINYILSPAVAHNAPSTRECTKGVKLKKKTRARDKTE